MSNIFLNHKLNEPVTIIVDLREEILKEHSKSHTLYISKNIGSNQLLFDELINLVFSGQRLVSQRSAWVLRHCVEAFPFLIDKHISTIIQELKHPVHPAIPRNILCILKGRKFDEEDLGQLADICFQYLESTSAPIAVRSNAMSILYDICQVEPDLANDLILVIETYLPHSSAGFKSRGNKIIKALGKKK